MHMRNIADLIARWSLILLAGLSPLFVIPAAWAGVGQGKALLTVLLVAVALVAWLGARLMEGILPIPRNVILFAAALLPLAYLVSAIAAGAPADSYASGGGGQDTVAAAAILFAITALYACVFYPAAPAHGGQAEARPALAPFVAFLIGAGAVIIFQVLRLVIPSWLSLNGAMAGNASSVFGSWHDLAILAALLVFFASVLWSSPAVARGPYRGPIALLMLVLGILSFALLIVIGMADVWYGLGALMLLCACYQWWSARMREGRPHSDALLRATISIVIGVLALLGGFGGSFIYDHLPKNFQISQFEVRPSWQGTYAIGEKVLGGGSGLIFGSGPNTFPRAWGLFKPAGVNQTDYWNVDFQTGVGLVPTSLVTSGVLGALAWVLLLCALLWRAWRFVASEKSGSTRGLHSALVGGALFLAAYHILYSPGIAVSVSLFLLIGLTLALGIGEREIRAVRIPLDLRAYRGMLGIAAFVVVAGLITLSGASIARATTSNLFVGKSSLDYQRGGTLAHSLELVQRALVVYQGNDMAHRASVELGLLQMQQLVASGDETSADELQAALSRTIQEGLKAVSINSSNYQNWLSLATLYQSLGGAGVAGAYDNALAAYQKAATANPTNPIPLIGSAQIAIAQNNSSSSMSYLDAAVILKPNLAIAYYLRSQVEARESRFSEAIEDGKMAVSLAQQDPLGWYNLGVIFYTAGDHQSAALALQQAVSLNNDYANALFVLSLVFEKLGDHPDAIIAMRRVVALNPSDETALQALANLEASEGATSPAKTVTPPSTR
ncbi:MAG TPA: tetratricopeptide repeat protein [Candidatus Paceibacterota bacterium]